MVSQLTEGSTYLFNTLLAPTFHEHERDIDAFLAGLQGRLSGVLICALTWAWGKAKGTLDLNIDLVNSSDSTTSQARPIDADPDFRPYPVATGPQPPTMHDPASGVMQQAYSVATRYAFQYLPVAINALQNARNPVSASRTGPQQSSQSPVYPGPVGGYDIPSPSLQYPSQQPGFDANAYAGPSQTIRQAVSSIYASSNTHPSTSDNPESLTRRRSGLLNANQHPIPTPAFISGATSRSTSDQDVPGTRASGSSHSSWGVASGYDEIRREELDDATAPGAGMGARPGSTRRTSSWFRWSSGAEQDLKDKTE
ncbi:hypothetical protein QFC21_002526 [Naganishia friedmannii]|uniref:Uncharacterized protein n=1 Tax=Naganishia friedmannii TaxID=89922 RepID=A0ACC2VUJ2_9TREE|nr:hypothetical protein QFC21_002526 [Naganishia friedmannii]